jgi:dihydrofolate synthase / folylpolyglutamate synthase
MDDDSIYQETLKYLYSFVDYSLTHSNRYSPENFDLERMRVFVHHLGNPQSRYPIIHIAGTKGKGSVASMCASSLQAAGYRTGLYTSPHLEDYPERIQINGQPIPRQTLIDLVDELRPFLDAGTELTTFEITTALAMLYFARQDVEAAVFEVGLGGRLDATNVVIPRVSVITSLSYDHTAFLGNSLAEIAGEKGGIIKPGVPVVLAPQKEEARLVIERICQERGSPLFEVGRDLLFSPHAHSLVGQSLLVWLPQEQERVGQYLEHKTGSNDWTPVVLNIPLLGYHQVENAATAYAALLAIQKSGLEISAEDISQGFANVHWPGRFEILQQQPPVLVDSAHNRDSALKLRLALDDYFPGIPIVMIFGASEDKDIEGMFAELMPRVRQVIATRSYHPRSLAPEKIVELAHRYGRPAKLVAEIEEALKEAIRQAEGDALVLATGSLFVAAGVRETWLKRPQPVQDEKLSPVN